MTTPERCDEVRRTAPSNRGWRQEQMTVLGGYSLQVKWTALPIA